MLNNLSERNDNSLDTTISYGKSVRSNKLQTTSFEEVLHTIKTGSNGIKENIENIRACSDNSTRQQLKLQLLPYFNMGQFKNSIRDNAHFERTQHIILDADHIGVEKIAQLKEQLKQDPTVSLAVISPSGDGMKVMYKLQTPITDEARYRSIYSYQGELFKQKYGLDVDHVDDPARACFVTYDPEVYVNFTATLLPVDVPTNGQANKKELPSKKGLIKKSLSGTEVGNRTRTVTQVASMLRDHGISEDFAVELVRGMNQRNTERLPDDKLEYTVHDMYDRYGQKGPIANYWSYGTDVLEIGIIDSKFYMENNPIHKVYVRAGAFTPEEKQKTYDHLVTAKHIPHIARVNYVGDIAIDESYYHYNPEKAEINVHYAPIAELTKDNQFVEDYLERLFGKYKQFVKEWLAVYCYTNYTKLPFLVLTGKRGSGKNTFAEVVAEIYPTLSTMWHGKEKDFNPEVEMKLLIADETVSQDPQQYKTLKKYSGQKEMQVNHKYLKPYKMRNNMNVIILSNANTPISVERDEKPVSEENNQFFVYEFKPLAGPIDTEMPTKLAERLGHYIRTELKDVFGQLRSNGNRYSIKTPITPEEEALFENNVSDVEFVTDAYIRKMADWYEGQNEPVFNGFVDKGYLQNIFFVHNVIDPRVSKKNVVKNLVDRGYLQSVKLQRKSVNNRKEYIYYMTDQLKQEVTGKRP